MPEHMANIRFFTPKLVLYPDPILQSVAREVAVIDERIHMYLKQMRFAMETNGGIGLAGPQLGIALRLITVKADDRNYDLVNPRIAWKSHTTTSDMEGCLSLPGETWRVERAREVVVEGVDPSGMEQSILVNGLTGRVFQHEVDHLDGILINMRGMWITSKSL